MTKLVGKIKELLGKFKTYNEENTKIINDATYKTIFDDLAKKKQDAEEKLKKISEEINLITNYLTKNINTQNKAEIEKILKEATEKYQELYTKINDIVITGLY